MASYDIETSNKDTLTEYESIPIDNKGNHKLVEKSKTSIKTRENISMKKEEKIDCDHIFITETGICEKCGENKESFVEKLYQKLTRKGGSGEYELQENCNVCSICGSTDVSDSVNYGGNTTDYLYCRECKKFVNKKRDTDGKEDSMTETQQKISDICDNLKDFLIKKNQRYGNSALEPARIFSKADTKEQILVRCDDKINRIMNSDELRINDLVDMMGYLVLLLVYMDITNFNELID